MTNGGDRGTGSRLDGLTSKGAALQNNALGSRNTPYLAKFQARILQQCPVCSDGSDRAADQQVEIQVGKASKCVGAVPGGSGKLNKE